jgi:hypothetical protein
VDTAVVLLLDATIDRSTRLRDHWTSVFEHAAAIH